MGWVERFTSMAKLTYPLTASLLGCIISDNALIRGEGMNISEWYVVDGISLLNFLSYSIGFFSVLAVLLYAQKKWLQNLSVVIFALIWLATLALPVSITFKLFLTLLMITILSFKFLFMGRGVESRKG